MKFWIIMLILFYIMITQNIIYGLRDPRNDTYYYIGKTTTGTTRPLSYLTKRSHNSLVNEWIKELNKIGLNPFVDIIEDNLSLEILSDRENYWIEFYKKQNPELFNGGKYRELNSNSTLTQQDIDTTLKVLSNLSEVYKFVKAKTGLTQEAISDKSGITRQTLIRILKNENVSIDTLLKLLIAHNKDSLTSQI